MPWKIASFNQNRVHVEANQFRTYNKRKHTCVRKEHTEKEIVWPFAFGLINATVMINTYNIAIKAPIKNRMMKTIANRTETHTRTNSRTFRFW